MENFTPASLQKFLGSAAPMRPQTEDFNNVARTNRGQRVSNILRNRNQQQVNNMSEGQSLDSMIRQSMAELVRNHVQAGKLQELKALLEEHRCFIDDILKMTEETSKK